MSIRENIFRYRGHLLIAKQPLILGILLYLTLLLSGCGGGNAEVGENNLIQDCRSPDGLQLNTIDSLVAWINAFEKPLSLPCFIQSLPRPLALTMTPGQLSAQPALGDRSPRVFFFINDLILTVGVDQNRDTDIPAAGERHLLEISFLVDEPNLLTVKAELEFPIEEKLTDGSPYERLITLFENFSNCASCHSEETLYGEVEGIPVYQSVMLKPKYTFSTDHLYMENQNCDRRIEPHRCAMLSSIVSNGEIYEIGFPADALVFEDLFQ